MVITISLKKIWEIISSGKFWLGMIVSGGAGQAGAYDFLWKLISSIGQG